MKKSYTDNQKVSFNLFRLIRRFTIVDSNENIYNE